MAAEGVDTLRMRLRSVQVIPDHYDLMREWTTHLPRTLEGDGCVALHMRAGSMKHFGLDKLPRPKDYGISLPGGRGIAIRYPVKKAGANQACLRIAYEWSTQSGKPYMSTFRLSSNWKIETVHVLADWLRENYEGPFEIRNGNGNQFYRRCFRNGV